MLFQECMGAVIIDLFCCPYRKVFYLLTDNFKRFARFCNGQPFLKVCCGQYWLKFLMHFKRSL